MLEKTGPGKTGLAKTGPAKPAPDPQAARVRLAFARHQSGDLAGAEHLLRQVLQAEPRHGDAARLLGEVLVDRGQFDEAIAWLQRLVLQQPSAAAQYSLGNACRLGGQIPAAISAYQAALMLAPDFAGSHHGLGACYRVTEREREALEHFRQAAKLQPDWAPAWKDLGLTFAVLGELGLAEAALSRAVALQPALADAQRHLAALRQQPPDAARQAGLAGRAADTRVPVAERIDLYFALGRIAEKSGACDAAFRQFSAGNALLRAELGRSGRGFDRQRLHNDIDRIIATWQPGSFARFAAWGNSTAQPVFIVGMPRAGSSLFEQIAASHPGVYGAGERSTMGVITQRLGWAPSPAWTQQAIAASAAEYLATLPPTEASRVIDKMPDNIFQLGLIAVLFPNARVIFCERDPRDLGLSCFFQRFSEPYGFDTDLADIAFRIRELDRLKHHWVASLPLRCLTFSYENLLAAPETESRKLIDFLGLQWDEKCLSFHQTERVVRTASWAQVRKPLYFDSVGRWKKYEAHLDELLNALS